MPNNNPRLGTRGKQPVGRRLGSFNVVRQALKDELSAPVPVHDPIAPLAVSNADSTLKSLSSVVASGFHLLPSRYHAAYVDVLQEALAQVQKSLKPTSAFGISVTLMSRKKQQALLEQLKEVFQSLAQPLVQLKDSTLEAHLKAYLALASNLYQRFLQDETLKRQNSGSNRWPVLDPLGFFLPGADGPYTLPPTRELPISIVAKPSTQMRTVPLWVVDGHEVGGHGVYSIVSGFDQEVAEKLKAAVRSAVGKSSDLPESLNQLPMTLLFFDDENEVKTAAFLENLAESYSQELAADLAGLLNFGPMFVNGLMLYFAALHKEGTLRNRGRMPESGKGKMDKHPPDVLRALVSIACLQRLGFKDDALLKALASDLNLRLKQACGGALPEYLVFAGDNGKAVSLPLKLLGNVIESIAECLMKEPLKCLGDRPLSQVLTWTELDQSVVEKLALTIGDTGFDYRSISDVEARHLVAASLAALEAASLKGSAAKELKRIQSNTVRALKDFYLDQCLLCAVTTYSKSRRTENSLKGKSVENLLKALRHARLTMKESGD